MMKLPLRILGRDESSTKILAEQRYDAAVSAQEYDFIIRIVTMNTDVYDSPALYLPNHAPQLAKRLQDECYDVFSKSFKKQGLRFWWQWSEDIINTKHRQLYDDDVCEFMMVEFCDAIITDQNIIGCHYRTDYLYETWPSDAGGIMDRKGFDLIDCDIFGCDLEYKNHEASVARNKPAQFDLLSTRLSVEYMDDHGHYQILTKEYGEKHYDFHLEHLAGIMQRSLRIIRKKILNRELERIV